jgi:hypothetical protein
MRKKEGPTLAAQGWGTRLLYLFSVIEKALKIVLSHAN